MWAEVLGVPNIGPWGHFFELGGTSIVAVRMLHVLEERLQVGVAGTIGTASDRARVRLCGLHRKVGLACMCMPVHVYMCTWLLV